MGGLTFLVCSVSSDCHRLAHSLRFGCLLFSDCSAFLSSGLCSVDLVFDCWIGLLALPALNNIRIVGCPIRCSFYCAFAYLACSFQTDSGPSDRCCLLLSPPLDLPLRWRVPLLCSPAPLCLPLSRTFFCSLPIVVFLCFSPSFSCFRLYRSQLFVFPSFFTSPISAFLALPLGLFPAPISPSPVRRSRPSSLLLASSSSSDRKALGLDFPSSFRLSPRSSASLYCFCRQSEERCHSSCCQFTEATGSLQVDCL